MRSAARGRSRLASWKRASRVHVSGSPGKRTTASSSVRSAWPFSRAADCTSASASSGAGESAVGPRCRRRWRARRPGSRPRPRGRAPRSTERCELSGCQIAQATSTATSIAAAATSAGPSQLVASALRSRAAGVRPRGSGPPTAATGPAAGHVPRGHQGHGGRAGHEPGPVDRRLHPEDEGHERQGGEGRALGVPLAAGIRAAVPPAAQAARVEPGGARRGHEPGDQQGHRQPESQESEVGQRLDRIAVRVAGHRGVRAVTQAGHLEGTRAHARERAVGVHAPGLAPVLAAGGRGGGEPAGALVAARCRSRSTSSSTRSLIEPPRPRSLIGHRGDADERDQAGRHERRHAHPAANAASAARPGRARRSPRDRRAGAPPPSAARAGRSPRPRSPWRPAGGASSRTRPGRGPTLPTAPAAAAGARSTGRLRRRRGTSTNQRTAPIAAVASAPRDWVSRMARIATPIPG